MRLKSELILNLGTYKYMSSSTNSFSEFIKVCMIEENGFLERRFNTPDKLSPLNGRINIIDIFLSWNKCLCKDFFVNQKVINFYISIWKLHCKRANIFNSGIRKDSNLEHHLNFPEFIISFVIESFIMSGISVKWWSPQTLEKQDTC